jgi:multisubunit Na+/H+ antiporter MnhC subunit
MTHDVSELTEESTTDLIRRASEQLSTLVRHELDLARAEMTEKAKRAGIGVGMFGAAGALAFYGVGAALVCIGLALALVLPDWLSALIVAVFLFAVAAVLALFGRSQLKRAVPPIPTEAVQSTREDVEALSSAVARRG